MNFVGFLYDNCTSIYTIHFEFFFNKNLGKVCEPNPCRNGGTCSPYGLDTYSCNCPFGYTGRDCETRMYQSFDISKNTYIYQ